MLVLKKKKIILFVLIVALTVFLLGVVRGKFMPDRQTFLPTEGRTIIIDAGHGGFFNTI